MEIHFSSIDQAKAVRDVIQHRILAVPSNIEGLPELELDEVMDLAAFNHRLEALIDENGEK